MLVLSRRIGETLIIGDDIKVRVLGITGMTVRIGIEAPKSVNVVREEIVGRDPNNSFEIPAPHHSDDYPQQTRSQPAVSYLRRRKPFEV